MPHYPRQMRTINPRTVTLLALREGTVQVRLEQATVRPDGTIWSPQGWPLLDGQSPEAIPKATAANLVRAGQWDQIPPGMYARLGPNPSGLVVLTEAAYRLQEAARVRAARREYDAAHPGAAERRAIDALYAQALRRREAQDDANIDDYYRLKSEADRRLAAWREQYPDEARQEAAADLGLPYGHPGSWPPAPCSTTPMAG